MTFLKKTLLTIGTITAVVAPISCVVACGSGIKHSFVSDSEYAELQKHDFEHRNDKFDLTDPKITGYVKDAVIESWIDGDTPIVTIKGEGGAPDEIGKHIRITAIDTPELHTDVDTGKMRVTTGDEFKWATKAKEFGEGAMPKGTKVKLFTDGSKSYDRVVGSLFYLENPTDTKWTNFGVEMLKNGLATSFVDSASDVLTDGSLLELTGLALADAYNYALKTSAGLFGTDIISILKIHGLTSDAPLKWTGKVWHSGGFGVANVYDYLGMVK